MDLGDQERRAHLSGTAIATGVLPLEQVEVRAKRLHAIAVQQERETLRGQLCVSSVDRSFVASRCGEQRLAVTRCVGWVLVAGRWQR